LTWAFLVAVVVAVTSPAIGRLTSFDLVPTVLLGAYVLPAALDSIAAGRLQGDRRFVALASYSTSQAIGKLLVVAIALVLGATVTGVLAAVIASSAIVAIGGRLASPNVGAIDAHVLGAESRRAFAAVTLFWLMISIDVPIAHARFDEHAAGVYAAGAVLGKAVLWIPVTVSQLVFPALAGQTADDAERKATFRKAALVIVSIAGLSVLGLLLVGGPVYSLLYGDRYDGASTVAWKVGLAMLPMALVNLSMFHHLARQRGRFVAVFAAGAVALAVGLSIVPATATAYALALGVTGTAVLAGMRLLESTARGRQPTHPEVACR
jgi:O-antigen/teichoic acid export membrane protein